MLGTRGGVDVVSCGMREGDRREREMEKEQDPRREDAGLGDRLEVELGRQNLLRTKRTALPQQTPTTMDEKRGEKLKKVRWIESGLVVNSEGKK